MIAVWLRCCLAAEVAAMAVLWAWLVRGAGFAVATAGCLALAVLIAVNALGVAAKYAAFRRHAFVPPEELKVGRWRAFTAIVGEAGAFLLVFAAQRLGERHLVGGRQFGAGLLALGGRLDTSRAITDLCFLSVPMRNGG